MAWLQAEEEALGLVGDGLGEGDRPDIRGAHAAVDELEEDAEADVPENVLQVPDRAAVAADVRRELRREPRRL